MCNRLGKKHPEYSDRNKNIRDEHGKVRRHSRTNRPCYLHYGHNALNAWADLRDKFESRLQWFENMKLTPAKTKRLERKSNLQSNQRVHNLVNFHALIVRRKINRARNFVTVIGPVKDNEDTSQ